MTLWDPPRPRLIFNVPPGATLAQSTQTLEQTTGRVREFERRRLEAEASNQKLGFELKQAKARVGDLGGALVQAHAAAAEALNSSRDARDDLHIASQQVTRWVGRGGGL